MPIYAYKCESCGHSKDVLQKMSDAPLTDCPQCGAATFKKQLTAAGFQLKGSGWYVTDFRDGKGGGDKAKGTESATAEKTVVPVSSGTDAPAKTAKSESTASAPAAAPAASPAPKAAP